jgi:hypothetical protein
VWRIVICDSNEKSQNETREMFDGQLGNGKIMKEKFNSREGKTNGRINDQISPV